jgi:hypothetical protein
LTKTPILYVFSTKEREWSAGFDTAQAPAGWRFDEYPTGQHGTKMFAAAPESVERVATWVAQIVARP